MALQVLLPSMDKAFIGASKYVRKLMGKLELSSSGELEQHNHGPAPSDELSDIHGDILSKIFSFLDPDSLVRAQLVCRAWRQHVSHPALWSARLSQPALAQLDALSALGPPVTAPQLYMATRGRNFLRNPAFRREANTQLLELGRSNLWGSKWTRNAWVENDALQNNVAWEARAEGLLSAGGAGEGAPPPPVPYAGGGIRLGERMQQGLAGLRAGLLSGLGAAAGLGVVGLGASSSGGSGAMASIGAAAEVADTVGAQGTSSSAAAPAGQAQEGMAVLQEQDSEGTGGTATSSSLSSTSAAAATPVAAEADGGQGHSPGAPSGCMEAVVAAAPRVSEAREPPSCIATTSDWCEVMQVVDLQWELQRRGLSAAQAAHLLDAGLGLRLAVHVGSRWDSPGECAMALRLDEGPGAGTGGGSSDAPPSLQAYVARPTRALVYLEREHMQCGVWEVVEHVVPACPLGFRRAVVMLRGRRAPVTTPVPAPVPVEAPRQQEAEWIGGGDDDGGSGGLSEGAVAEAGEDAPADVDVEPPTRFCGAKFASAQLVFC